MLLWCLTPNIFNRLMYVSLHHCSLHTVERLPGIQEYPCWSYPSPWSLFLKHDEKHILRKTSKYHGGGGPRDNDYLLQKERRWGREDGRRNKG